MARFAPAFAALSLAAAVPSAAAVSTAKVVYNRQNEIRQLLIDWVTANGTIDPADFASVDWRLVSDGTPITVS